MNVYVKALTLFLITIFLIGCSNVEVREIEKEVYIPIPNIYTQECWPERKDVMTIQEVIVEQSRTIGKCNNQLDRIRELNVTDVE